MMLRVVAAAVLLASVAAGSAFAQAPRFVPPIATHKDAQIAQELREKKAGAVAFDVVPRVGRNCTRVETNVSRQVSGGPAQLFTILNSTAISLFVALPTSQGGVAALPPGDYLIASVLCQSDRHRITLAGPYAAFQVRPGEVVNLGVLRLEVATGGPFGQAGKLTKSVAGMTQDGRAKMTDEFPQTFPLAVERRMTLIGPAEVDVKRR